MPGNTVRINNSEELNWYVGDSKMDELIAYLDEVGFRENDENEQAVAKVGQTLKRTLGPPTRTH